MVTYSQASRTDIGSRESMHESKTRSKVGRLTLGLTALATRPLARRLVVVILVSLLFCWSLRVDDSFLSPAPLASFRQNWISFAKWANA